MSEITEEKLKSDSENKVNELELEHAQTYRELVRTVDKLMQITVKSKGLNNVDQDNNFVESIDANGTFTLGTLHQRLSKGLALSDNPNNKESLETIASFLRQLIKIRRLIIEQRLITAPLINTVYPGTSDQERKNPATNGLDMLLNEKNRKNIEATRLIQENFKLEEQLNSTREKSVSKLNLLRDKVAYYRGLCKHVNDLNEEERDALSTEEYEMLKKKYRSLVRKDKMLSQFNINLISSLSNADILNDQRLKEMILFCGDYSDYSALRDEDDSRS